MSKRMQGLLLEDRWAPVTSAMGFLEMEAEQAARACAAWQEEQVAPRGMRLRVRSVPGSLEQVLSALLPLSEPEVLRRLFLPTRGPWTGYVDNGALGTDAAGPMSHLALSLGRRSLNVVAVPHSYRWGKGAYGAVVLDMFGPSQPGGHNSLRALSARHFGSRWVFEESGTPFPFERREQYARKRERDRFTLDLLREYLGHLGLAPFEEDFYLPGGAPAWLVERTGPVLPTHREYTLEEVRDL